MILSDIVGDPLDMIASGPAAADPSTCGNCRQRAVIPLSSPEAKGIRIPKVLHRNDAYHALDAVGCLVRTGPTGTNVNDVAVALLRRRKKSGE